MSKELIWIFVLFGSLVQAFAEPLVCRRKMMVAVVFDSTVGVKISDFLDQQNFIIHFLNHFSPQEETLSMSIRVFSKYCPCDHILMSTEGFWATSDLNDISRRVDGLGYFQAGKPFVLKYPMEFLREAQSRAVSTSNVRYNILLVRRTHLQQIQRDAQNYRVVIKNESKSRFVLLLFRDKLDQNYPSDNSTKALMLAFPLEDTKKLAEIIAELLCNSGSVTPYTTRRITKSDRLSVSYAEGLLKNKNINTSLSSYSLSSTMSLGDRSVNSSDVSRRDSSKLLTTRTSSLSSILGNLDIAPSSSNMLSISEVGTPKLYQNLTNYVTFVDSTLHGSTFTPQNTLWSGEVKSIRSSTSFEAIDTTSIRRAFKSSTQSAVVSDRTEKSLSSRTYGYIHRTSTYIKLVNSTISNRSERSIIYTSNGASTVYTSSKRILVSVNNISEILPIRTSHYFLYNNTSSMSHVPDSASTISLSSFAKNAPNSTKYHLESILLNTSYSTSMKSIPHAPSSLLKMSEGKISTLKSEELLTTKTFSFKRTEHNFTTVSLVTFPSWNMSGSTAVESSKLKPLSSTLVAVKEGQSSKISMNQMSKINSQSIFTHIGSSRTVESGKIGVNSQLASSRIDKSSTYVSITPINANYTLVRSTNQENLISSKDIWHVNSTVVEVEMTKHFSTSDASEVQDGAVTRFTSRKLDRLPSTIKSLLDFTITGKLSDLATSLTSSTKYIVPTSSAIAVSEVDKDVKRFLSGDVTTKDLKNDTWTKDFIKSAGSILGRLTQKNETIKNEVTETPQEIKVVLFVEKVAVEMAKTLDVGESKVIKSDDIVLKVASVNTTNFRGFSFSDSEDSNGDTLALPSTMFDNRVTSVKAHVAVFSYKSLDSMKYNSGLKMSPKTFSAKVDQMKIADMPNPLMYTMKMQKGKRKALCSYWNFHGSDTKYGAWSSSGCSVVLSNASHVTCACDHMTNFAVLMQVHDIELSQKDKFTLMLMSQIGCGISILGCLLLLTVFTGMKKLLREDRNVIHVNLALAIGIANSLFLLAEPARINKIACTSVAIAMFYFLMAAFFWMLIEGIHVYLMVVKVFRSPRMLRAYSLIGWVLPLLITIPVGVRFYNVFGMEDFCWLTIDGGTRWVFVGPVVFVLLVNSVVLFMTLRASYKMGLTEDEYSQFRVMAKLTLLLMPIFGLTWLFGLLAVNEHLVMFQYIFTVLNSLQGFFIFLFYCIFNSEVRREYQNIRKQSTYAANTSSSNTNDRFNPKGWRKYDSTSGNVKLVAWTPITPFYTDDVRSNGTIQSNHSSPQHNGVGKDLMLLTPMRKRSLESEGSKDTTIPLSYGSKIGGSRTELLHLRSCPDETASEVSYSSYKPYGTVF